MNRESRAEGILNHRRKTQQIFNPMGEMTTQDAVSLGITNRGQASFLRTTLNAISRLANPKRLRNE